MNRAGYEAKFPAHSTILAVLLGKPETVEVLFWTDDNDGPCAFLRTPYGDIVAKGRDMVSLVGVVGDQVVAVGHSLEEIRTKTRDRFNNLTSDLRMRRGYLGAKVGDTVGVMAF